MTRLGWFLIVLAFGLGFGIFLSRKPWEESARQRAQTFELRSKLEKLEREQAEVVKTRLKLDTPLGREVLSRERGFRKPNEIPMILP